MTLFGCFVQRIEGGELDPGDDLDGRTRKFAKEVIANAEQGHITAKEAAMLWLLHLKRLGFHINTTDI